MRETHASLYPTVSIGGSATRNAISANKPMTSASSAHDYWDFLIPLNITWEPDLWGAVRRQIESASASAQASAADLANTRLSLQGLLAVTYLQLRGLDLQAQLLRSTIDAYTPVSYTHLRAGSIHSSSSPRCPVRWRELCGCSF